MHRFSALFVRALIVVAPAVAAGACRPAEPATAPSLALRPAAADTEQSAFTVPIARGNVLYVLDGRVLRSQPGKQMPAEIRALDPGLIASVEVLKGVAAKERYGAEGENGVVMITTRKPAAEKQKS